MIMLSTFKVQFPLFGDVVVLGLDARTLEPRVRLGHVSLESGDMLRHYDDFKEEISAHCRSPGPVVKRQLGPDHGLAFHSFSPSVTIEQRPPPGGVLPIRMTPATQGWTVLWSLEVPIKASLNRLATYSKKAYSWIHAFAEELLRQGGSYGPYNQYLCEEDTRASQRFWLAKQFFDHWEKVLLNVGNTIQRQLLRELCSSDDTPIIDEMMSVRYGVPLKMAREDFDFMHGLGEAKAEDGELFPADVPCVDTDEEEGEEMGPPIQGFSVDSAKTEAGELFPTDVACVDTHVGKMAPPIRCFSVDSLMQMKHSGVVSPFCADLNTLLQFYGNERVKAPNIQLKPSEALKIGLRAYVYSRGATGACYGSECPGHSVFSQY